jgi:hypothetical protein
MGHSSDANQPARLALVRWAARLGAVTAEALAARDAISLASARARLQAAERAGMLAGHRPLAGEPTLYAATRAGIRAAGSMGLDPGRVSAAGARHAIVCAAVAASLERAYPDHYVMGEPELRLEERRQGDARMVSARLSPRAGVRRMHRADLLVWPPSRLDLPVAVEVELTVKAAERLVEICRAWARCRGVSGVLYLVSPEARRPLERAVERSRANGRITAIALDVFARDVAAGPAERTVAGRA